MEQLTNLTIVIGTMAQREAIAMRIITVVTLIFLPATFVSVSLEELQNVRPLLANRPQTFFSTDIVKYQDPNEASSDTTIPGTGSYKGTFSQIAMERWLQLTISLTFLTLLAGWAAFRRLCKNADRELEAAQQLPFHENELKGSKDS